jgi:hypothetical protein
MKVYVLPLDHGLMKLFEQVIQGLSHHFFHNQERKRGYLVCFLY